MSDKVAAVRNLAEEHVHRIAMALQQNLSMRQVSAIINAGAWANKAGLVAGYVSCYPQGNASELSIDAVLNFVLAARELHYSVDISWSDGSAIEGVAAGEIAFTETDDLLHKVREICQVAENELGTRLLDLIIQIKGEPPSL